jgi:hypothetical protein
MGKSVLGKKSVALQSRSVCAGLAADLGRASALTLGFGALGAAFAGAGRFGLADGLRASVFDFDAGFAAALVRFTFSFGPRLALAFAVLVLAVFAFAFSFAGALGFTVALARAFGFATSLLARACLAQDEAAMVFLFFVLVVIGLRFLQQPACYVWRLLATALLTIQWQGKRAA